MTARTRTTPTMVDELYDLAQTAFRFVQAPSGLVAIPLGADWPVAIPIGELRYLLTTLYQRREGRVPSESTVKNVLAAIQGAGMTDDTPRRNPQPRVAQDERGRIILDLNDGTGRAAVVSKTGVRLAHCETTNTNVCFSRTVAMGPLPQPDLSQPPDAIFADLAAILNLNDDSIRLLVAWLLAALFADIAHPILILRGEQGTAKTTTGRLIGRIIDKGDSYTRPAPVDVDHFVTQALPSWVVVLDNVSRITPEVSDAICRAVTGDSLIKRKLYSDADWYLIRFRRALIITTIEAGAFRGDLAERALPLELQPIKHRLNETDVEEMFAEAHPRILGSLLNLAAKVLAERDTIHLAHAPRMADFAHIVAAMDAAMGWDGATLTAYSNVVKAAAFDVLESSALAAHLLDFIEEHGEWRGTAKELLARLEQDFTDPSRPKDWPRSAKALSATLARIAPALRRCGWHYDTTLQRTSKARPFALVKFVDEEDEDAGAA